jgi:hypothetical protein
MRKLLRTCLVIVLVCTLAACKSSKLDRIVASLDAAASIPVFPAQVKQGFSEIAIALRTVRDNPTASNWQTAVSVFEGLNERNVFKVSDPDLQLTISSIVAVVRILLDSAAPVKGIATAGERSAPDVGKLNEADVKALERAVKAAKK